MKRWTSEIETELTVLLKDWLKQQGRTQADLRRSLRASSTRMPAIMEVLEREHRLGGMPRLAARLCAIEAEWSTTAQMQSGHEASGRSDLGGADPDPFGQLDLLLQEIRDDRVN